jgi:aspartyl-tRNA(Asn)/glutamyl-tRNA(Gln) amidotransferase subunit A
MSEIYQLSLCELVEKIKSKEISCEDATQSYVDRASRSKKLNCYIEDTFDVALKKAKSQDQNFNKDQKIFGAPIAVKDLFCTKGVQTTASSKMLEGFKPEYESTVTSKLWEQGGNLLGKLNCDEYAMGSSNETSYFGNVINPYKNDKDLVPGGSSGGSASAVAANLTSATVGTDTGGSIRQPASFTGIVGLKPTYGRCSRWGIVAFASSLDQAGPMTKTVKDSALILEVISGHDHKDSTSAKKTNRTFQSKVNKRY